MMITRNRSKKIDPALTLVLAVTLERNQSKPRTRVLRYRLSKPAARELRYRLSKPAARELHEELRALWNLYHNAERMVRWLRNFARALPRGDLRRGVIASELRSARRELRRIQNSREGA